MLLVLAIVDLGLVHAVTLTIASPILRRKPNIGSFDVLEMIRATCAQVYIIHQT